MNKFFIKALFGVFFAVSLLVHQSSDINSQDSVTTDPHYNYTISLEEYQRSHNRYVLARSNYLRFKTLAFEEQAFNATQEMLVNRDEVVVAYIDLLLERVRSSKGLDDAKVSQLLILLEAEKDWFELHSNQLTSAATLSELVAESNGAKTRYDQLNMLVYEVFSYLSYGRVYNYQTRLIDVYSDLRVKFENIRSEDRSEYRFSSGKIISIDNWLVESQSSITRSDEKLSEIRAKIDLFEGTNQNGYNRIVSDLQDSRLHMLRATSFMEEVIREIKTAEN